MTGLNWLEPVADLAALTKVSSVCSGDCRFVMEENAAYVYTTEKGWLELGQSERELHQIRIPASAGRVRCPNCENTGTLQDIEREIEAVKARALERARRPEPPPAHSHSPAQHTHPNPLSIPPGSHSHSLTGGGAATIQAGSGLQMSGNMVNVGNSPQSWWANGNITLGGPEIALTEEVMAKLDAHETCMWCGMSYDPRFKSKRQALEEKLDRTRQELLHPLEVLAYEAPEEG